MEFYIHLYAFGSFLLGFGTLVWWITATVIERKRQAEYAKRKDFELDKIFDLEQELKLLRQELLDAKATIAALEIHLKRARNKSI